MNWAQEWLEPGLNLDLSQVVNPICSKTRNRVSPSNTLTIDPATDYAYQLALKKSWIHDAFR